MTRAATPAPHDLTTLASITSRALALLASFDMSDLPESDRQTLAAIRAGWQDDAQDLCEIADEHAARLRREADERRLDLSLCRAQEGRDEHDHNTPEREH